MGEEVLSKEFEKLSGGNKRRVCMEVCLLGYPELVYLDECSTGLDPLTRRIMLRKQNILKEPEGCLVFTSHCLGDVERLCEKILILQQGRVLEYGTVAELKKKHCPYFLVDTTYFNDNLDGIKYVADAMGEWGQQNAMKRNSEKTQITWQVPRSRIRVSEMLIKLEHIKSQKLIR